MLTRSLEINNRALTAYEDGRLSPEITDNPNKVEPFVLSSYRIPTDPVWVLQMRGSHRRERILEWCIATMILQGNSSDSDVIDVALLLPRNDQDYESLKKVFTFFSNKNPERIRVEAEMDDRLQEIRRRSLTVHYGYIPRLSFLKRFDPNRVAPKAYIGKGYTDQGHIGTSPSWQSQMISGSEQPQSSQGSLLALVSAL